MLNKLKVMGVILLFITLWGTNSKKFLQKFLCAHRPWKLLKNFIITNEIWINYESIKNGLKMNYELTKNEL
jgi:hypothetical protein